jgi:ABC-2 type transport system ATP-binding protein
MLQLTNLLKKYGDKTILDIEELKIPQGIIHLKGINGSGKTTFSKIIAGMIPYEGRVILDGSLDPSKAKKAYRMKVNYAESEPNFPDFLSANDLIVFTGKAKKAKREQRSTITKYFGVDKYLFDTTGTYSSGMLKRLSLCLAFLGNPSLIILDEPFNTLDAKAIEILLEAIETKHKEGVNFILVSHQDIGKLGVDVGHSFLVANKMITEA